MGPIINSSNYKVICIHKEKAKNLILIGSLIKKPIEDFFNNSNTQSKIEDNNNSSKDDSQESIKNDRQKEI